MRRSLVIGAVLAAGMAGAAMAAETAPMKLPGSDIIPAERLADWRPGVTVGVPGGIRTDRDKLIDVTQAPYNADNTGKADVQPAIMQAIADAKDEEVVYLPAGTYRIDKVISISGKSNITLRGAGPDKTVIMIQPPCGAGISIQGRGGWYRQELTLNIADSPKRGQTVLNVGDTKSLETYPEGGIGLLCQLSLKNDPKLPVMSTADWGYLRKQISRIVARTATTVTISPGLLFDLPESLSPRLTPAKPAPGGRSADFVGIEDLSVDGGEGNPATGVSMSSSYGCWLKNVAVRNIGSYYFSFRDLFQCQVESCHNVGNRLVAGRPRSAGVLFAGSSFCLFQNNTLADGASGLIVEGGSAGNVFAYNFSDGTTIQGTLLMASFNSNHGAHPSFNLYEGNVGPRFQCDGYHGSASDDTAFRNRFHGTSTMTSRYWVCVNLNRFTRNYNLVGNILGSKGHDWLYEVEMTGFDYEKHFIYSLGFPNMGNGWCDGKTAQPSKGKYWADWDPVEGTTIKGVLTERTGDTMGKITLSSGTLRLNQMPMMKAGDTQSWVVVRKVEDKVVTVDSGPWRSKLPPANTELLLFAGANGFQELDLDVKATTLLLGNYNYKDNGVPESESLKGKKLPASLYLSEKPEWFGDLAWPPFGPDAEFEKNSIPAELRYDEMVKARKETR